MRFRNILIVLSMAGIIACAPPQQFAELKSEADKCKVEREQALKENELLNVKNTELEAKLAAANKTIDELNNKHASEGEELKLLKKRYQQLNQQYEDMKTTNKGLLDGTDAETKKLISKLEKSQLELYKKEEDLNKLSIKIDEEQKKLKLMRKELDNRNARLVELEQLVRAKDSATNALRKKVSEALLGFANQGLTVTKKNGKVYVSLDEKLLFGSGSTTVDERGVQALKQLAGVLEQNPDIDITIEGHTDDVPVISSDRFQDNWDLSVKRSTSIIRILLDNSAINPKRLTASGRGEFLPVDNAKTKEARQKNRRTEIILTPNLDEILNLLGE